MGAHEKTWGRVWPTRGDLPIWGVLMSGGPSLRNRNRISGKRVGNRLEIPWKMNGWLRKNAAAFSRSREL